MIANCRMGLQLNLINHCTTASGLDHTWISVRKDRRYRRAPDRQLTKRSNFVNTAGQPQNVWFSLSPWGAHGGTARSLAVWPKIIDTRPVLFYTRPHVSDVGRPIRLKNMCQTNAARYAEWKYARGPSARARAREWGLYRPTSSESGLCSISLSLCLWVIPLSPFLCWATVRTLSSLNLSPPPLPLVQSARWFRFRWWDGSSRGKQVAFRRSRQAEAAIYRSLAIATSWCPQLSTDKTSAPLCRACAQRA